MASSDLIPTARITYQGASGPDVEHLRNAAGPGLEVIDGSTITITLAEGSEAPVPLLQMAVFKTNGDVPSFELFIQNEVGGTFTALTPDQGQYFSTSKIVSLGQTPVAAIRIIPRDVPSNGGTPNEIALSIIGRFCAAGTCTSVSNKVKESYFIM